MTKKSADTKNMQDFEVFGREHIERPLQHLGSVEAENTELAIARARFVYSEREWIELCIAPTNEFYGCLKKDQKGVVGVI